MVRRVPAPLLWRPIPVCPLSGASVVRRHGACGPPARRPGGKTGVEQLGVTAETDPHVLRSNIEMQYTLGVRGSKRRGKLGPEVDRPANIERAPGLNLVEGLPRHELEHEKQLVGTVADLEQGGDVRVRDRGGSVRVLQ